VQNVFDILFCELVDPVDFLHVDLLGLLVVYSVGLGPAINRLLRQKAEFT